MMEMYDKPQPLERYLDRELKCRCGRTHYVPIKAAEIGSAAQEVLRLESSAGKK